MRIGLIDAGIDRRPKSRPHNRPSPPCYSQKIRKGKAVTHFAEERVIKAVIEMNETGMSLRRIAKFLSEVGVPTKNRGKAWHPQMVQRLLKYKITETKDSNSLSESSLISKIV